MPIKFSVIISPCIHFLPFALLWVQILEGLWDFGGLHKISICACLLLNKLLIAADQEGFELLSFYLICCQFKVGKWFYLIRNH